MRLRFIAFAYLAAVLVDNEAVLAVHRASDGRTDDGRWLALADVAAPVVSLEAVLTVEVAHERLTSVLRLFGTLADFAAGVVGFETVLTELSTP